MANPKHTADKTTLSRRNALAALGSLPALGIPIAGAAVAAATDPIFAAIEAHKRAWAVFEEAVEVRDKLHASTPKDVRRQPRVEVGPVRELISSHETLEDGTFVFRSRNGEPTGEMYYAYSLPDIERNVPRKLSKAEQRRWIALRHQELKADMRAQFKKRKAAGLQAAMEREREMSEIESQAAQALATTVPTTMAGLRSLMVHWARHINDFTDDDTRQLIETLSTFGAVQS
jgi:hypothetical protein